MFLFSFRSSWIRVVRELGFSVLETKEEVLQNIDMEIIPLTFEDAMFLNSVKFTNFSSIEFEDKLLFQQFVETHNLSMYCPKKYTVDNYQFPLIFKRRITCDGNESVVFTERTVSFDRLILDNNYIIQEYVRPNSLEFSTYCIVKNGVIKHAITYRSKIDKKDKIMKVGNVKTKELVFVLQTWIDIFNKFFSINNYNGFAVVDHLLDGTIFEINPRIGGLIFKYKNHLNDFLSHY